jgi:hypothetical protein
LYIIKLGTTPPDGHFGPCAGGVFELYGRSIHRRDPGVQVLQRLRVTEAQNHTRLMRSCCDRRLCSVELEPFGQKDLIRHGALVQRDSVMVTTGGLLVVLC